MRVLCSPLPVVQNPSAPPHRDHRAHLTGWPRTGFSAHSAPLRLDHRFRPSRGPYLDMLLAISARPPISPSSSRHHRALTHSTPHRPRTKCRPPSATASASSALRLEHGQADRPRQEANRPTTTSGGDIARSTIISTLSGASAWSFRPALGISSRSAIPPSRNRLRIRDTPSAERSSRRPSATILGTRHAIRVQQDQATSAHDARCGLRASHDALEFTTDEVREFMIALITMPLTRAEVLEFNSTAVHLSV